jgi:hypothetical protein
MILRLSQLSSLLVGGDCTPWSITKESTAGQSLYSFCILFVHCW